MKKTLLFLFTFTVMLNAFAQDGARFKKVDSLLNYLYANNKFMGSVSIREKNKVVFEKAYGFADLESQLKATPATKYKIGPVTKMFTAAVIFQLIEEKKLTLDTKLSEFYPEFKNAGKITIASLLNHSSGLYDFTTSPEFAGLSATLQPKTGLIKKLAAYPPAFEPGIKSEYSNTNYMLLGYIIEKITGKTYKSIVTERVINKAGLKNTYYYSKINPKRKEAFSYTYKNGQWARQDEWHESVVYAAGALQSTPGDLTQFVKALFDGRIIKKTSLDQMLITNEGYGSGIFIFPFGERRFYGHNGTTEGFTSVVGYYPKDELGLAITLNASNYNINDMVLGILSIYYKLPYRFPNIKSADVDVAILKSYEGLYTSPTVPLKIVIRYNGKTGLTAQATDQGPFPLSPVSDTDFIFDAAGIEVIFRQNGFTIKQGGTVNEYTRE